MRKMDMKHDFLRWMTVAALLPSCLIAAENSLPDDSASQNKATLAYTPSTVITLADQKISVTAQYEWSTHTIGFEILNIGSSDFNGTVTIKDIPSQFTIQKKIIAVSGLKAGASTTCEFKFKTTKLSPQIHDYFRFIITSKSDSKSIMYNFPLNFASEYRKEVPCFRSWLSSDSYMATLKEERKQKILADFDGVQKLFARYVLQWDRAGKGLYFHVDLDDPQYIEPTEVGKMDQKDSVQLFFDQLNNASSQKTPYEQDDLVLHLGSVKGTPKVFMEYPERKELTNAKLTVSHKNKETSYDLFIPAEYLPYAKLTPGSTIGFGIQVNQRMKGKNGEEYTIPLSSFGSPVQNVQRLGDWVLSKRCPYSYALVNVIGQNEVNLVSKSGKWKKVSDKYLTLSSDLLGVSEMKYTGTFTPNADGVVRVQLTSSYAGTAFFTGIKAKGAKIINGDFKERDANGYLKNWWINPDAEILANGILTPFGRDLYQDIKVKRNVPVTITISARQPDEAIAVK